MELVERETCVKETRTGEDLRKGRPEKRRPEKRRPEKRRPEETET